MSVNGCFPSILYSTVDKLLRFPPFFLQVKRNLLSTPLCDLRIQQLTVLYPTIVAVVSLNDQEIVGWGL